MAKIKNHMTNNIIVLNFIVSRQPREKRLISVVLLLLLLLYIVYYLLFTIKMLYLFIIAERKYFVSRNLPKRNVNISK